MDNNQQSVSNEFSILINQNPNPTNTTTPVAATPTSVPSTSTSQQQQQQQQPKAGPSGLRLVPIKGVKGAYYLRDTKSKSTKVVKNKSAAPQKKPPTRPRGRPKKKKEEEEDQYIPPLVGKKYQAVLPECQPGPAPKDYSPYQVGQATPVLLWKPTNDLSEQALKQYLTLATSVLLFPEEVVLAFLRFHHNNVVKCTALFSVLKTTIENIVEMDDKGDVQSFGIINDEQFERFMAIEHQLDMVTEMVSGKIDDRGNFVNSNELFVHRFRNPCMPPIAFNPNRPTSVLPVLKKEFRQIDDSSSDHLKLSSAIKRLSIPPQKLTETQMKIREKFLLVRRSILFYERFDNLFPQVRELLEKKRHDEETVAEILHLVTV